MPKVKVKRNSNRLYYINKRGDVMSVPRRGIPGKKKTEIKDAIEREEGKMYFVDSEGFVRSTNMKRRKTS